MKTLELADSVRYRTMTTEELRASFLITDLFKPGELCLTYVDADRAIIGSVVPVDGPLVLPTYEELKAEYFTERREIGVLNIGGAGVVTVGDDRYELDPLDS